MVLLGVLVCDRGLLSQAGAEAAPSLYNSSVGFPPSQDARGVSHVCVVTAAQKDVQVRVDEASATQTS